MSHWIGSSVRLPVFWDSHLDQPWAYHAAVEAVDGKETRSRAQPYLKEKGCFLLDRGGQLRVREYGAGIASDVVFEQKLRALLAAPPQ